MFAGGIYIHTNAYANPTIPPLNHQPPHDHPTQKEEEDCALCHEEVEDGVRAECGCGFCRLCVTEYVASAATGGTRCPKCAKPLTVDLSSAKAEEEPIAEEEEGKGRGKRGAGMGVALGSSNRAGTAVVAGRVKLQGLDRKSILHRIQLENFQSSTKLEVGGLWFRGCGRCSFLDRPRPQDEALVRPDPYHHHLYPWHGMTCLLCVCLSLHTINIIIIYTHGMTFLSISIQYIHYPTLKALLEELDVMQARDPSAKAIVFSQFVVSGFVLI